MDACHCQNLKNHENTDCGGDADENGICIPCKIHCLGIKLQPVISRVESILILEQQDICPECGTTAHTGPVCPRATRQVEDHKTERMF